MKRWRPENWQNPNRRTDKPGSDFRMKGSRVTHLEVADAEEHCYLSYEAGADAMLEAVIEQIKKALLTPEKITKMIEQAHHQNMAYSAGEVAIPCDPEDLVKRAAQTQLDEVLQVLEGKTMSATLCDVCHNNEAIGVACVPMVPCSVAYCADCLRNNSHPMNILIANTACIGGLEHANECWVNMVHDSLKHQDKTLDWFNSEVSKEINDTRE